MKWFKIIFIYSLLLLAVNTFAQKERKYMRQGNKEFEYSNYQDSEVAYRKAIDLDEKKTHKPAFNVGDALYKQEKYEDAIDQFNQLTDYDLKKEEKAKIYHNIGNSLLKSEKYQESIDAFKNALRNNPNDMDTKYNLVYAQKKLAEQQQQQQQNQDKNQDKDKDKDKENEDQNKDQQNKDKNKDEQDQEKNKDNKQQDQQDQNKEQEQQQLPHQISKQDAERILQAIANDEKDTQKKVKEQQAAAAKVKTEKEW